MADRVVLLLDGGFVKKKLQSQLGHFPSVAEVVQLCQTILADLSLQGKELFRITTTMRCRMRGSPRTQLAASWSTTQPRR